MDKNLDFYKSNAKAYNTFLKSFKSWLIIVFLLTFLVFYFCGIDICYKASAYLSKQFLTFFWFFILGFLPLGVAYLKRWGPLEDKFKSPLFVPRSTLIVYCSLVFNFFIGWLIFLLLGFVTRNASFFSSLCMAHVCIIVFNLFHLVKAFALFICKKDDVY